MENRLSISVEIYDDIHKVWDYYVKPDHIVNWAFASDDWESPFAENDLRIGGKFVTRMQAKDGSNGFDLTGTYNKIINNELIGYVLADGRDVEVRFKSINSTKTIVDIDFEPENVYDPEFQKQGWQSILNNFKKYVESK